MVKLPTGLGPNLLLLWVAGVLRSHHPLIILPSRVPLTCWSHEFPQCILSSEDPAADASLPICIWIQSESVWEPRTDGPMIVQWFWSKRTKFGSGGLLFSRLRKAQMLNDRKTREKDILRPDITVYSLVSWNKCAEWAWATKSRKSPWQFWLLNSAPWAPE